MRNHLKLRRALGKQIFLFAALFLLSGCSKSAESKPIESKPTEFQGEPSASTTPEMTERTTEVQESKEIKPSEGESGSVKQESDPAERGKGIQQRIVIATDLHYLAEELSGNRGDSFMEAVNSGDGRVLQYGWEIMDAFIEEQLLQKPDLIVLSGDLTLNGEKKSHEELADKLSVLLEAQIPVIVLPGNHDINNSDARKFTADGAKKTDVISAGDFAQIYADFGYTAADSRDSSSLSYLYRVDDYYWLMMLDSCQYTPVNQIGGMIRKETYDWMEEQLELAWEQGAQVITVSHHNLLEQSGVSPEFYDNCTIEHNEELIQVLSDWQVRLHLSGHLHLQHYMEDESGIYEIITGALVMEPCHYGVLDLLENGTYRYEAKSVDVSGWAKRNHYKNRDLADFAEYSEAFLWQNAYQAAVQDLREHTAARKLLLSDGQITDMAKFYAELCVYYYSGRMYEIADSIEARREYEYWNKVDYISDLSSFLRNILEDEARDFSSLEIPY